MRSMALVPRSSGNLHEGTETTPVSTPARALEAWAGFFLVAEI